MRSKGSGCRSSRCRRAEGNGVVPAPIHVLLIEDNPGDARLIAAHLGSGLPHGVANSVMLPHAIRYNREVAAGPLKLAAHAFSSPIWVTRREAESASRWVEKMFTVVPSTTICARATERE